MKGHLLYSEDHDDTRSLMALLLRQAGFEVTEAACGVDAWKLARDASFDLYLLDYTFPDASGITICAALREFDKSTPILFYSGRAMPQQKDAAIKAGAEDYLIKPQDLFQIAAHVEKWMDKRRATG